MIKNNQPLPIFMILDQQATVQKNLKTLTINHLEFTVPEYLSASFADFIISAILCFVHIIFDESI
jgi:hypothetical protein